MARKVNEIMYIKCLAHCLLHRKYPIHTEDIPVIHILSWTKHVEKEKVTVHAYYVIIYYFSNCVGLKQCSSNQHFFQRSSTA